MTREAADLLCAAMMLARVARAQETQAGTGRYVQLLVKMLVKKSSLLVYECSSYVQKSGKIKIVESAKPRQSLASNKHLLVFQLPN